MSVFRAGTMGTWLRQPFPPFIFSLLNTLTPMALPSAVLIAMTFTQIHRYQDYASTVMSNPNFFDPLHYDTYDFIIVGGGSAGSVLANRLSKFNKVLLLEAGGNPHPLSIVPIALTVLFTQPSVDWQYKTVSQQFASFAFENNVTRWPRGKSLGGSSILNAMIYMRGNQNDFDQWANLTGDDGWRFKNVLPFFKKLETYRGYYPNASVHGTDGPINVEPLKYAPGLKEWLLAARELGYKIRDLNGVTDQEGFAATETTIKNGRRSDTYRTYLRPLRERHNLTISRFSYVTKIHLDRQRNAYGVSYVRHGVNKFVRADKEIVISAGAVNSPHLLMLSGIGRKRDLNSMGLTCRANLNVGKNLQDHVMTILGPITVNSSISFMADRNVSVSTVTDWLFNGAGPLSTVPAAGSAFLSSSYGDPSWPDLFFHQASFSPHRGSGPMLKVGEEALQFRPGLLSSFYGANEGQDSNFVTVSLGRPFSRGEISLQSSNPFDQPLIDPKYLKDPRDVQIMIEGVKMMLRLFEKSRTYQGIGAKLPLVPLPGCESYEFRSDQYWECYIRSYTLTIYHACCTTPMGKKNDTKAVLDSEFRVRKTRRLRVIDASAMPIITNANLNIPTIMMAERGAHLIRQYWAKQYEICILDEYLMNPKQHDLKCFYSRQS